MGSSSFKYLEALCKKTDYSHINHAINDSLLIAPLLLLLSKYSSNFDLNGRPNMSQISKHLESLMKTISDAFEGRIPSGFGHESLGNKLTASLTFLENLCRKKITLESIPIPRRPIKV